MFPFFERGEWGERIFFVLGGVVGGKEGLFLYYVKRGSTGLRWDRGKRGGGGRTSYIAGGEGEIGSIIFCESEGEKGG